jgi:MFS family permease
MALAQTDGTIAPPTESDVRKIIWAAFIGTALEWYDYFLYGTAAAIVFAGLFFTTGDPAAATLVSFLSFGVGFVARPIGAVVFSHIGDRYGRRTALIGTLVLMGISTGLIGLLPTYAAIGLAAPALLTALRIAQGLSAGGEWGGATLLAIEYTPPVKRGRYASIVQLGSPAGTVMSSGAFALVALLPKDQFLSWGWRLPFLLAFALLALALWLRWRVEETPLFRQILAEGKEEKLPVLETFRTVPGRLFVGAATYLIGTAAFFVMTTFMISYITKTLGMPKALALSATIAGAIGEAAIIVYFGKLADKIGAAKVCALGCVISILVAFPVFWLVDTKVPALVILGVTLGISSISIPYAPVGATLSNLFPSNLQYSGIAISANLSNIVAGFAPFLAVWLAARSGNASWAPALLLMAIATISLLGALAARSLAGEAQRFPSRR